MKLNIFIKIALPTLIVALGFFVIITPIKAHALSAADWKPGRIIDDAVFFNKDAMNVQQIQDFLNSKVPVCDTNHNASFWMNGVWNAPPYTCLKNYSQNGKSSAQIIWEAGQAYGINPQAIIVILQKETGLVTDTWAAPWQYDRAMGYACPDTAACDTAYYGFTNQVNSAARQLRNYVNNPQYFNFKVGVTRNVRWHPNAACGSSAVYIETQATAALYNYTPYQPNGTALSNLYGGQNDGCSSYGNRNFWVYFNNWFGSTISGKYMSPLYRSDTSGMIFAIINNKKFYIPSFDIMVSFGFHKMPITSVPDSYLSGYDNGGTLTNIGRKEYDTNGTIFLFDDGKHYAIASPEQCANWALDCFNANVAKVLPNELMDHYISNGGVLTDIVNTSQGFSYKIEQGKKRPLIGMNTLARFNASKSPYFKDNSINQPLGAIYVDDRFIIKFGDIPNIYMHEQGKMYPLNEYQSLVDWGLINLAGANLPAAFDAQPLPRTNALAPLATDSQGRLFVVSNGIKYTLPGREQDFSYIEKTSININGSQLDRLPSAPLQDVLRAKESGEIFTVSNSKKRVFASFEDIYKLGFSIEKISNIPQSLADKLGYSGLNMPEGKLYKAAGSNEIRVRKGDGYLYVSRLNYPALDYSKTINVDRETGDLYARIGEYQP